SPAFWDFDNDGDLDMFRSGRGFDENPLMLLPNVGVPYSPTWGAPVVLDGVAINQGNDGNYYRGDPFTFADHDLVEGYDLFVQGQDGRVRLYYAYAPAAPGELPTFILAEGNEDWMSVVHPDHTDIVPGGIALADFDYFEDGWAEMIVSYIHDDVGNIVWVDTLNGFLYDLPDLLPAPDGIGALDPYLIESLAAGDLDLDGVPDLVVTISYDSDYAECEQLVYLTVLENEPPFVSFTYAGRLDAVYENDHAYARNIGLGDTDADGDADLFIGHRNPINTSSRYYLRHYVNQEPTKLTFERRRGIAGSNINLALYFYDDSTNYVEVKPDYRIISNPSGGALDGQAIYTAGISAPQVDVLETTNLVADHEQDGERRMFVDVLPTVSRNESKAILVLGTEQGDALHDTFAGLLGWAYQVLLSEGLSKENIYVLSSVAYDLDRDGFNDVAGAPTLAALQQAILNWAPSPNAADPLRRLLVYLIDHGQLNNFRMNASEYLRADVYAGWIDQIQASLFLRPFVTTVVDTCESGSFVDDLSGADRVTITSAGVGPLDGVALFDKDSYISFSLAFWNNIYFGRSYGEAFDASKISMEAVNPLQTPQIDDNGNGISNETNDGLIADLLRPGANFYLGRPTLFIGEVAPYQAITSNSATLWVAGIQATFPVEEVSAIVVPPNYGRATSTTDDEQPVSGLPLVKLQYQEARERWEGVYNGFTQGGQFQILYFVKTAGQFQATPRIGFVDRVNIADAWEPDNTPGTAPWIPINTVQGHNFHQNADEDWVRFTSPAGQKATFGILSPGPNCRPWIELYRQSDLEANPNAAPVQSAAAAQRGEEVVFERHFVQAEQYLLRIRNVNPALFGAGTSYMLIVAVGTGGSEIIPTTLVVSVVNGATDDPLEGAEITFNDSAIGTTTVEGIAYAVVPSYGQYDVEAEKSGYRSTSRRVSVNNIVEPVLLEMTEQGAEGEGEGEGDKVPAICGGTPTSQRSLRADLLILAATATLLLVKIGVKRRHS
ncbi:MAG: hypothetical protein HYZ00_12265, partial [Candidatus Hydrogenedentes bacterium]|nr:hypothetical protein [Candidatus Hydrogenedentota bacterium]